MSLPVAVSGANGFIGSALVRQLVAQGRTVRALIEPGASVKNLDDPSLSGVERISVDICDRPGMERALGGCEVFHHLAAIYKLWLPDPEPLYRVNVEGTTVALLAAQKAKVKRVVHTSSLSTVGMRNDGVDADENVAFNLFPIANDYILSKHLSERVALRFAHAGMPIVVVNPGFPFGPRDSAPTPTGKIVLSVLRGQVPGIGAGGFSAIDVDDLAAGHLAAEEKGRVGERYILSNHNVSLAEFIRLTAELAGVKPPRLPVPSPVANAIGKGMELWSSHVSHAEPLATYRSLRYLQSKHYLDNQKARRELGLPSRPLADSIRRAIDWFRQAGVV